MKKIILLIIILITFGVYSTIFALNISFIPPTPENYITTTNKSIIINTSINNASLISTAFIDYDNTLVAWYRFNNEQNESNTFYIDWSVFRNNLTCSGTQCPSLTSSGRFGSARNFDGNNDFLISNNSDSFDFSNSNFSIDLWVYSTITDNNYRGIIGYQNGSSTTTRNIGLWVYQRNRLHVGFGNGTHWLSYTTPDNVITTNGWTHIVVTFDGKYMLIYINGNLRYNLTNFMNQKPYPNRFITVGRVDNYFRGIIDEIKIYKRVLTADEVKSSYNASAYRLYLILNNQSLGVHSFIAYVQNSSGNIRSTEKRFIDIVENSCNLNQTNFSSSCSVNSSITTINSNESIILANNTNLTIQNLTNFTITSNSVFTIDKSSSLILDLSKCLNNCNNQSLTISANEIIIEGKIITTYSFQNITPKHGPNISLIADKILITGNISLNGEKLTDNYRGDSGNIKIIGREIGIFSTINLTGNKSGLVDILAYESLNISNATLDVRGINTNGTINITWGKKLDESNATFLGKLPIHTKYFENGSITFEGQTDFRNISTDLEDNLIVFNNFAFANSTKYPYLNRSAIITFYDLPWKGTEMIILKDGKVCTDCQLIYTNGSISSFRVNSFSNYTTYSNITQCGTLSVGDTYYSLNTSITFNGVTCLTVNANNVMIDGRGFSLIGLNQSNTKAIYANGRSDLKIYNLTILNVSTGIHLIGDAGDRVEIVNTTINMSFASGCSLGLAICEAIIISDVDDVLIRNVTTDTSYYGIALYSGNNNITIRDSTIYARNFPNIQVRSLQTNITIFNNSIIRRGSGSTALELVSDSNSRDINISNNYIQSPDYGITISNDPQNIYIINNTIHFGISRGIAISGLDSINRARNILIQNNLINGSYFHFRIDNYLNNVTFENNTLTSNFDGNYIIHLNGNTQSISNLTIRNNYIEGRTSLMYIRQFLTNNTGTNEFLFVNNNIFNNTYPSDSTTYSNCVFIENNNSNIFFWNNTFICYRFFVGSPTNPPNFLHNLTNVWANFSDIGNRYIFRNGSEVWPLKNITDTDGNFFANIGSDLPFNHVSMTTTHWLALINDSHPFTLRRHTLCGEQVNLSLTLNNSLNCSGTALLIIADNVTLDCANFSINHSWSNSGSGIVIQNRKNVTIRNCNINKFSSLNGGFGIFIFNSSDIRIENTRISTTGATSNSVDSAYVNNLTLTNLTAIVNGYNSVAVFLSYTNNSKFSNLNLDIMNNPRAHIFLSHSYNNEFRTIFLFNKTQAIIGPIWIYYSGNNYLGNVSDLTYNDIYFYDEYDIPDSSWNITVQWPIIVNITDSNGKPIYGANANYSLISNLQFSGNFSQMNANGIAFEYLNDTLLLGNNSNITFKTYNITGFVLDNNAIKQNSTIVNVDSQKIINLTLHNLSDPLVIFLPPTPNNNQIIYNDKNIILNSTIYSNTNAFGFYDLGDLIAYWTFDHFNSTHLIDISRYNNHGTFAGNNNQSNVTGRFGYGFLFDGVDDRMIVPNSPSLNPTREISIVAWFNSRDWASNRRILQKGNSDNQYRITAEYSNFKWHITGITEIAVTLPTLNQWHQVVGTYNGSEQRLYINGVLNFTRSAIITLPTTNDNLEIGSRPNTIATGDRFNGTLDEIMIFSRALTAEEVLALYNNNQSTLVRNISNLIQNYSSNYTIRVYAKNALGNMTIVERNFSVYIKPYVAPISPNNASYGILGLRNFTCYANESVFGLKNGSIFIYYSNGTLFYSNSTTLNGIAQNFTFTVNLLINDTYYWNCLAYDKLDNYTISDNFTYYVSGDTLIYTCSLLDTPNREYVLGSDVSSQGTCFSVIADNITLDCNGYTINFGNAQLGNGVFANSVRNLTIKNCNIRQTNSSFNPNGWINGTYFFNTNNSRIINTTIFTNSSNATGSAFVNSILNQITNLNTTTRGINSYGILFTFSSNNNSINGFNFNSINNSAHGIFFNQTSFNNATNINMTLTGNTTYGVYANVGSYNRITNIVSNAHGSFTRPVYFASSSFNTLINATFTANHTNSILIDGTSTSNYYVHNLSNISINNAPAYYYTGTAGYSLSCNSSVNITNLNASFVGFGNCNNINVSNINSTDGIIMGFVTNSRFENLNITSIGRGILIYQSSRINFTNLNVSTNSTLSASSAIQFDFQTSNITIRNANIVVRNNNGYGISGYAMTQNYFYNVNITITNTTNSGYGIYLSSANTNTFENISIITNGSNNHAIFFNGGTQQRHLFKNVNITTYGGNSHGIYLYYTSTVSLNNFTNFNITVYGSNSKGIEFHSSENNTVEDATITTYGASFSYGIYVNGAKFNRFRNINISTFNTSSSAIAFNTNGNSNNFSNINISTNGSNSHGIYLFGSSNNIFNNLLISTNITNSPQIFFYTANNNLLANITFAGQAINHTYIRDVGQNFLLNASNINKSAINFFSSPLSTWNVTLQWYVRLNITDVNLNPLLNALGNYTNALGISNNFSQTDLNGLTNWLIVNETTIRGSGGNVSFNNYLISATKTGYLTNQTSFIINESKTIHLILQIYGIYCGIELNTSMAMTENISCTGNAIKIIGNNIVLDCNNFVINYSSQSPGIGIEILNASNVSIRNCNIYQTNSSIEKTYGILLNNSNYSSLLNINIAVFNSSNSIGIHSSNVNYLNGLNTSAMNGYGLMLVNSNNNSIINSLINSSNAYHFYFENSSSNLVSNTSLRALNQYSVLVNASTSSSFSGNNRFLNVTNINEASGIIFDGINDNRNNITIQWYVMVNVTYVNGNPLANANVNAKSNINEIYDLGLTNSNGLTSFAIVNSTTYFPTSSINHNPHNFSAIYGVKSNSTIANINTNTILLIIIPANTPPVFVSNSHYWNNTKAGQLTEFKINISDDFGISGYIFAFDNCTGSFTNSSWIPVNNQTYYVVSEIRILNSTINDLTNLTLVEALGLNKNTTRVYVNSPLVIRVRQKN